MSKNIFNSVKMTKPPVNRFDLSHDVKLSLDMGQLVPIMCMDCVPGDKVTVGCESLLRFAPLVSPVMHRLNVYMHYWFVPKRLLWDNWEKYITNTPLNPAEPGVLPAFPYTTMSAATYTQLADYLGIPNPIGVQTENVSAMPFSAYQLIWNEFYRDQNLIDPTDYKCVDGNNSANAAMLNLQTRAWEHDYFTAALPWAQKGGAVDIPLGTGVVELDPDSSQAGKFVRALDHDYSDVGDVVTSGVEPNANITIDGTAQVYDPTGTLIVNTEATTINDLRRAFRLQEWLEKAARGGSRYIESILAHFGVRSSDKRLQRPEYITGTVSPVVISEVVNTAGLSLDDPAALPQGNMAGHGVSVTSGKYGTYFCEEHGYIMGIMSVMPKTAYQQGIPKHFLKINDPFEHYFPSFANIGEQEVQNRELYAFQGATGDDTFGYVPRYAEYKFEPNRVAGDFRTTLNFWHMGRIFEAPPALNATFVTSDPTNRIFAVSTEENHLYAHVLNKVSAVRKMPKFGTPTF